LSEAREAGKKIKPLAGIQKLSKIWTADNLISSSRRHSGKNAFLGVSKSVYFDARDPVRALNSPAE